MKQLLTLLFAAAALTAPAQVKIGIENQAYTISSAVNASIANATTTTIQWYCNGVAIPACTTQTCVVPAALATGDSVRFVRKVSGVGCAGDAEGLSNEVIVTFKCGGGHGTRIGTTSGGSLCWADRNVDAAGAFTTLPSDYGRHYQWNRNKGWASSDAATGWNATADEATTWTVNPLPCPTGWRLPTNAEFVDLDKVSGGSGGSGSSGGVYVAAGNTRSNGVAGRFYGPNCATCTTNNLTGCVFFPATGYRNPSNGALTNQGAHGEFWSSTQVRATNGYNLHFTGTATGSHPLTNANKAHGFTVRCVQ